jgi:glucose/mannose transport system substrate-binding protein
MKRPMIGLFAVLVAASSTLLAACGSDTKSDYSSQTKKLEVLSWWVSPSEKPALQVLIDAYKKQNAGVDVTDASVAGGAGSNVQVALASRLRAGDPPDLWQTFPGQSLSAWAGANDIVDVSDVFQSTKLGDQMPKALLDASTWHGKQWGVPTEAHRQNNLFFNTAVLAQAGVTPPKAGYTADQFVADLAKVNATGKPGLCLGAKDRFTSMEVFENTLLGNIGTDGWSKISSDKFDWGSAPIKSTLTTFDAIMSNTDPKADGMTWSDAAKKFATGGCGFLSMNDSAYAEVQAAGAVAGKDFGYVAYPGTDGKYLAIVDTFVAAAGAKNGVNAKKFLETIASPEVETAFSAKKGSVPLRKDADVSSLSPYQQDASKALWSDPILLSMTDGELIDSALQQRLYDAVADFKQSRKQTAFIDTIRDSGVVPAAGG